MARESLDTKHESLEENSKLFRDLFLGFVKVHLLYHASQEPIYGSGISAELERHGYRLSPGTLYPVLHSLDDANLLEREDRVVGGKVRKYYRATPLGERALEEARSKILELVDEIMDDRRKGPGIRRGSAGTDLTPRTRRTKTTTP
jgi:PadR family transcriptional regulator